MSGMTFSVERYGISLDSRPKYGIYHVALHMNVQKSCLIPGKTVALVLRREIQ